MSANYHSVRITRDYLRKQSVRNWSRSYREMFAEAADALDYLIKEQDSFIAHLNKCKL